MSFYVWYTCLLLLLGASSIAGAEDEARLLGSKSILNNYIVDGRDLTIQYRIYNVGSSSALAVSLQDSYPEDRFKPVRGFHSVRWERIAPGTNVSHTVVLTPIKDGVFNFTGAQIDYEVSEGGRTQTSFSSAPGEHVVILSRDFDRRYSPHILDWAAFGLMSAPTILMPFIIWYRSYSHYAGKDKKA